MLSREEIKKWLLENCVNGAGDLNLDGLDFSDFDGNIYISNMKVKYSLFQRKQKIGGSLVQDHQTVEQNLYQNHQAVDGDIYQDEIECSSKSQVEVDELKTETNELIKENQELKEKLEGYETLLLHLAKELKEGK